MAPALGMEYAGPPEAIPRAATAVTAAARTDAGPCRPGNEDAVLIRREPSAGFDLFAVADGLGGHQAGEVASRIVVDALAAAPPSAERPERWLRQTFNAANLAVWNHAHNHPDDFNLQSTGTALVIAGGDAIIGHVGDCRVYLLRDGEIELCTTDHTRAMEMLRLRIITPAQALNHPARSQLTRSIGAELFLNIDISRRHIRTGDVYVLCSDGLWSELSRDEIADSVLAAADPSVAAASLLHIALARGAADNVSVVVVGVDGPVEARPPTRGRRWLPWQ